MLVGRSVGRAHGRARTLAVVVSLFAATGLPAPASGAQRELAQLRTVHSRTFQGAGDRRIVKVSAGPLNYRDAGGRMTAIDDTLVADGEWLRNRANAYRVRFPRRLAGAPIRVGESHAWVAFALRGAASASAARPSGSRVSYAAALPGVDLNYQALPTGIKEVLDLSDAKTPSRFTFDLTVAPGLTPHRSASGEIELTDRHGSRRLKLGAPFMRDAAGSMSSDVRVTLRRSTKGWRLRLVADRAWLHDASRRFPVQIDPTVEVLDGTPDLACSIGARPDPFFDAGGNCFDLQFGRQVSEDFSYIARTLVHFDLSGIPAGAVVDSATLSPPAHFYDSTSATLTAYPLTRPFTEDLRWGTSDGSTSWTTPGGDYDAAAAVAGTTDADGYTQPWNVTDIVGDWVAGTRANDGLILISSSDDDGGHFDDTPSLSVEYEAPAEEAHPIGVRDDDAFDSFEVVQGMNLRVNLATGNLVLETLELPDLTVPSGIEDDAQQTWNVPQSETIGSRFWNSFDTGAGSFGDRSRLGGGVDVRLTQEAGGARRLIAPSGYDEVFTPDGSGGFDGPGDFPASLAVAGDGTGTVTMPNGDELVFSPWASGAGGYLTDWRNRDGSASHFSRDAGGNTEVIDPADSHTTFTSTSSRITGVTSADGTFTYDYDGDELHSVTDQYTRTTTFHYDASGRLTRIEPQGFPWEITYDASGRVHEIKRVPGFIPTTTTTYAYGSDTTTVSYPDTGDVEYRLDPTHTKVVGIDSGESPPVTTLSGSLATSAPTLAATGDYDLDLSIADADGIKDVAVIVDDDMVATLESPCPSSPCSLSDVYTLHADDYAPGIYNVEVYATDDHGSQHVDRFSIDIPIGMFDTVPDDPEPDPTSEEEIARAKTLREGLGLDATDAHVRAVQGDSAYDASVPDYSIRMTPAEVEQVKDRIDVEGAGEYTLQNFQSGPDYAGSYTDASGVFHVGFSAHVAEHTAEIEAQYPYLDKLQVFSAAHSFDSLQAIVDDINDDADDLRTAHGIDVTYTSVADETNDVEVGVDGLTPTKTAYLQSHYGSVVRTVEHGPWELTGSRSLYERPIVGGLSIRGHGHDADSGDHCSSGFGALGRPPRDYHFGRRHIQLGRYNASWVLSAGHCTDGDSEISWSQGGRTFGASQFHVFADNQVADALLISAKRRDVSPWVYHEKDTAGKVIVKKVGDWDRSRDRDPGQLVCVSGAETAQYMCGNVVKNFDPIVRVPVGWPDAGSYYKQFDMGEIDVPCKGGDSGAPVVIPSPHGGTRVTAFGIITGADPDNPQHHCMFEYIQNALNQLATEHDIEDLVLATSPQARPSTAD